LIGNTGVLFDVWDRGAVNILVIAEALWELFLGIYAAVWSSGAKLRSCRPAHAESRIGAARRFWFYGAAPESNRPSRGLHDRTDFEEESPVARSRMVPRIPQLLLTRGSVGGTIDS
jgi:hypothetical protein